jgi:hypothetical protein
VSWHINIAYDGISVATSVTCNSNVILLQWLYTSRGSMGTILHYDSQYKGEFCSPGSVCSIYTVLLVYCLCKLFHTLLRIVTTATAAVSQAFSLTLTDKSEVEGLPQSALAQLAQSAVAAGETGATGENGPWRVTLDMPSYLPVMQHAKSSVSSSNSA